MYAAAANYPWTEELKKTVVHSLVTTFGLDFILFEDKQGGDVNTIHNVRNGVWATDEEKQKYDTRGEYTKKISDAYHKHENYKTIGKRDANLQDEGKLIDPYRGKIMHRNEQHNLDHVIAAKEIHDDAGRVLAGLDGVELANRDSNLQTTLESINKSKKQTPMSEYLQQLPARIETQERQLASDMERLAALPRNTPQQQHEARKLEDSITKHKEKISKLKEADPEAMLEKDQKARKEYNESINSTYYASSKFLKSAALTSGVAGLKIGTRQMLGLIAAEFWFELREALPSILKELKKRFSLERFLSQIKETLGNIWTRLKTRFSDFLIAFKDGVFAGVLANMMTTIFNIFATTSKNAVKLIRETWGQLTKAIKLLAFNPENLGFVDLCKAVTAILNTGVATLVGSLAYAELLPLCNFPFGGELAAFCGALLTGLVTLGMNYVILHSEAAQKIWAFVQTLMPHMGIVTKFQAINAELDNYLTELAKFDFNLNAEELQVFAKDLANCNNELERSLVLRAEVKKRDIELPFEMGNHESTRKWLSSLTKK
ncbi:MAG: hypothetical protein AB7V34_01325 [Brachymonas sp.]